MNVIAFIKLWRAARRIRVIHVEMAARRDANAREALGLLICRPERVHNLLYSTNWNNSCPSMREVATAAYIVADEMEIARDV